MVSTGLRRRLATRPFLTHLCSVAVLCVCDLDDLGVAGGSVFSMTPTDVELQRLREEDKRKIAQWEEGIAQARMVSLQILRHKWQLLGSLGL